jgi:hypothetical protein
MRTDRPSHRALIFARFASVNVVLTLEEKRLLSIRRCRRDHIRIFLEEIGYESVEQSQVAQDRKQ